MNTNKETDFSIIKTSQGLGIVLQALEPFFNEWGNEFPKAPGIRARTYGKYITLRNLKSAYDKAKGAAYFEFTENGGQQDVKDIKVVQKETAKTT